MSLDLGEAPNNAAELNKPASPKSDRSASQFQNQPMTLPIQVEMKQPQQIQSQHKLALSKYRQAKETIRRVNQKQEDSKAGINQEEMILMNNEIVQANMIIEELEERYNFAYSKLMQLVIN